MNILYLFHKLTPTLTQMQSDGAETSAKLVQELEGIITKWFVDMHILTISVFVILVGVIAIFALRWLYKSTPEWLHSTILTLAEKAVDGLAEGASRTSNTLDDKLVAELQRAVAQARAELEGLTSMPLNKQQEE